MDCESIPRRPLRAVLPALKRRPHVTRRPMQGQGLSEAAASWSSMPTLTVRPDSDEFVSGRPRPICYYGDEMPGPLPIPSASFDIVSTMPECLQSRAQETSLDLPAWVENTNRHTLQSGGGVVDDELVPWMQLPQPLFSGITRSEYRETPLYSEPSSPNLSRAYATDEVACPQPRPPIVSWATFGLGGDSYPGFELEKGTADSGARDDSSYYGDAEEEDRASVSPRRNSGFSIKCQGHEILELAPLTFGQPVGQPVKERALPRSLGAEFMDWVENGGSCRSSMCYSECAYEEYATPLAPTRARIVHISGDSSQFPTRTTSLLQPNSCEPSPTTTSPAEAAASSLHLTSQESTPDTPNYSTKSFPRPFTPYYHNEIFIQTPPLTPINFLQPPTRPPPAPPALPATPTPPLEIHNNHPTRPPPVPPAAPTPPLSIHHNLPTRLRQRKHIWGSSASEMSSEIINDICAATRGSSIKKLTLDYPCVIVIRNARRRWRTYDGWYTNPATSPLGHPESLSTSMFLSSGDQSPTLSAPPSLFPPSEVGSKDTENEAVWSQGLVTRTATPITDLESDGEGVEGGLPEADLEALRRIFPESNAKWYGILYAHMVCYNYIMDLERGPSFEHMEEPLEEDAGRQEAGDETVRYRLIMRNLEYCISRIICRMGGKTGRSEDRKASNELRESHLLLTRSLSTFIRSCEASIT